ncbi:hypothetical protein Daesc_007977 [Daldinia eschscholtzii]|uniref:DOMON domain-containing protein n=1 Tax=Daldinia eschscholtzii TaxID=292717 RepID=A0AAX6MH01_9PEZI
MKSTLTLSQLGLAVSAEGTSWAAVGLGSDRMAGALVLLAYSSESGQNVTLSPRIASGHSEPVFTPEIKVDALDGTGLNNGTFIFNGRCTNCRSWLDGAGKIDVASKSQNMIYATGDTSTLKSDSFDAPLRMHYNYGTFTLDMVHATGPAGVPTIDRSENSTLVATTQGLSKEGKKDVAALMHAIIMVFVGFPLAQASQYNYVLAGLILFLFPVMMLILITKKFIQKRWNKSKNEPTGYNMEPWNQQNGQAGQGNSTANPQQPLGQNVSIPAMSSYVPYHAQGRKADLGPRQNTQEYV